MEKGETASTLIMDVPTEYPDGAGGVYKPINYDSKFHGPVLLRSALANSYNIPAVKTLQFIGVNSLKEMAARMGITTLTRDDYGLSLTLGGGEVSLLELTGAYQAIANGGKRIPPTAILKIEDAFGRTIFEDTPPAGQQVIRPEHAYIMANILSDNQARLPAFGANNPLQLSRPAAVKTGTTNDYRDSWTVGFTPDIVTGAWVGNPDYTPMNKVAGSLGAAYIWHGFMEQALQNTGVSQFIRPAGIVEREICKDSGAQPSAYCPEKTTEIFAADQLPLGPEKDIHQMVRIDTSTNALATDYCPKNLVTEKYFTVYPPDGREWAISQGIEQPPDTLCPAHSGAAQALISSPVQEQTVNGVIRIEGVALAANFSHYDMEYGVSWGPQAFGKITEGVNRLVEGGELASWDTTQVPNGPYTLRVLVYDQSGGTYEGRVNITIDNPKSTSTPKPTKTPTRIRPTETQETPPTATSEPTGTPIPQDTATAAPTATSLVETTTPTQSPTPTATTEAATATQPPEPTATI